TAAARNVVPRTPIAGTSRKPAAIAPSAAPVVFAAYSAPASAAAPSFASDSRRSLPAPSAPNHDAATGNVAPIAAARIPTSINPIAIRTTENRSGAEPSAYAQRRVGIQAASRSGSASAKIATANSRAAYTRSRAGAATIDQRPAAAAPIASPPMKAAST